MPCISPPTLSTGYVYLDYIHVSQSLPHRTHIRLSHLADPLDAVAMFDIADQWGDMVKNVLDNHLHITGWGTQSPSGTGLLQASFSTTKIGTHASAAGAEDYKSRTVSITGHGTPGTPGSCKGPAITRLFVGDTYNFVPGQKFIAAGADPTLDFLANFLETQPDAWYDFYGQKATVRGTYPVQFHAYIQRRQGQ